MARISYSRFAPAELEARRRQRIGDAPRAKLPKLAGYRRAGLSSILVLEDDDIALSNHSLIGSALHEQLALISVEPPDFVFLVETSHRSLWFVCTLKAGDQIWPGAEDSVVEHREFDCAELTDIFAG